MGPRKIWDLHYALSQLLRRWQDSELEAEPCWGHPSLTKDSCSPLKPRHRTSAGSEGSASVDYTSKMLVLTKEGRGMMAVGISDDLVPSETPNLCLALWAYILKQFQILPLFNTLANAFTIELTTVNR